MDIKEGAEVKLLLLSISRRRLSARVAPGQGSILSTDISRGVVNRAVGKIRPDGHKMDGGRRPLRRPRNYSELAHALKKPDKTASRSETD